MKSKINKYSKKKRGTRGMLLTNNDDIRILETAITNINDKTCLLSKLLNLLKTNVNPVQYVDKLVDIAKKTIFKERHKRFNESSYR